MSARTRLSKEIHKLHRHLLEMTALTETAIERAIQALKERDDEAARQIVADDERINKLRYKIEKLCVTIIATQQPMASDLRTVFAAAHIAVEIERIADHAAGIAKLIPRMSHQPLLKPLIDIPRMAEIAREMLRGGVQAFIEGDVEAARALARRDEEIDQLYEQVLRELLTYMLEDPRTIQRATYLLWVAHGLERIGDRAINISERVVFTETGKFLELE